MFVMSSRRAGRRARFGFSKWFQEDKNQRGGGLTAPQRRIAEAPKTDAAVLTSQRAEITAERWNATPESAHTALLPHGLTANG